MRGQVKKSFFDSLKLVIQLKDDDVILLNIDIFIFLSLVSTATRKEQDLSVRILRNRRVEVVGSNFLSEGDFSNLPINLLLKRRHIVFCVVH